MNPYIRNTSATRKRTDSLRRLATEFSARDMSATDMQEFLCYSASGTRKYIHDLRQANVIEVARYAGGKDNFPGYAIYRAYPDAERLRAFLDTLERNGAPPPRECAARPHKNMAGRNIHLMADDTHYPFKLANVVVARDSLVAALFGAAGATA